MIMVDCSMAKLSFTYGTQTAMPIEGRGPRQKKRRILFGMRCSRRWQGDLVDGVSTSSNDSRRAYICWRWGATGPCHDVHGILEELRFHKVCGGGIQILIGTIVTLDVAIQIGGIQRNGDHYQQ